ncbi:MAG: methyltransferase domain-containing protein [Phycisphaerae bacterium]|nr:methyltransferase domain-containing protein [Phycisphaerae bacterium]
MRYISLDTPNTSCMHRAFLEMLEGRSIGTFIEVGPGCGHLSQLLCSREAVGVGIDFSPVAISGLKGNLAEEIARGRYSVIEADFMKTDLHLQVDLVFSMLVMEHVADDMMFLRRMKMATRQSGIVLTAVPGRKDKWGIDDELYGHIRRYDRADLFALFRDAGFADVHVRSIAVPISNLLFGLTNWISERSRARARRELPLAERTKLSGQKDIPYKKVFPPWFRLVLNEYTYCPFHILQRLFYKTNLGLVMIASGRRP